MKTDLIIKSLRHDIENERGSSLLQLVYMILNSNTNTPFVLTYNLTEHPSQNDQCYALRALMFRIQLMLCSRVSNSCYLAGIFFANIILLISNCFGNGILMDLTMIQ